jgi:UDP-N-acetylglucosamine 4,6-dehydratase
MTSTSLSGRTVLITGGTGSFGNAVLRRFLTTDVAEIRVFSRDEKKQDDMRNEIGDDRVRYYIGDVRDFDSVEPAMPGVDYVYHAAALKQVPSCEFYPMEAVKTNVMGTENVLNAARSNGISKVICLSTDKAVYPINAMGISKAMMEKVMVAHSRTADSTKMMGTRYGNVMASRGSVIPLFIGQIRAGEPLTVTDSSMTRFMMSMNEAVNLVLYAFENGAPGDIFVQKAPAATIGDLARALLELFDAHNEVRVMGTRHGEKLYETLLTREEMARSEDLGDYYRIAPDARDLNYRKYFSEGEERIATEHDYNSHNTRRLDIGELKKLLMSVDGVRRAVEAGL